MRGAQWRAVLHQRRDRLPGEQLVLEAVGLRRHAEDLRSLRRDAGGLPDQAVGRVRLVGSDVLAREALGDELVADHLAGGVDRRARAMHARRAFRVPRRAVGPHALHPHRLAGRLREERRVERGVSGVVAPVGARPGNPDRPHFLRRHAEQPGHPVTHKVGLLRSRPHRAAVDPGVGNRAAGTHAGMRLERPLVLRFDDAHARRAERRCQVALLHGLLALHDLGTSDVLVQLIHRRKRAVERMPVDLQPLRRSYCVPLAWRDHRDEVLLAHDARAADRPDRGLVHASYFARRPRRPDDPRVEHAFHAHVGDEPVGAVNLPGDVAAREGLAHHPVLLRRLGLRLDLDVHRVPDLLVPLHGVMKILAADQLAVGNFPSVLRKNDSLFNPQLLGWHTEALRTAFQQKAPRFRRGAAQQSPAIRYASAARGATLVARGAGVAHQHVHLVAGDIELVGHDLRDRDLEALPHVHLAEEGLHAAVGQHRHPGIELGRHQRRLARGDLRRRLGERWRGERNDQRSGGLQEFAASQSRHDVLLAMLVCARLMARRMATWVPQRHLSPARASRSCASLAFGFFLR